MSAIPTPLDLAARLSARGEDFAWLDSAGSRHPDRDTHSWLAWGRQELVEGALHEHGDRSTLRDALANTRGTPLLGWVGYDGGFRFARFEHLARFPHGPGGSWSIETRNQSALEALGTDPPPSSTDRPPLPPLAADSTDAAYLAAIGRALAYIAAGDIYQVNISRRWSLDWLGNADPLALYRRWRARSAAPQSAFLRLGGTTVLSASPETFLTLHGNRVRTHPIKGTTRASDDPAEDESLRHALASSAKERAELLMITDLLRNDLGQVAVPGSVRVPALHVVESFGHLHHLVSSVEAQLRPDLDALDLLATAHPGGSITGAPKKRATEIIAELEPHPRGIYCGAIGWLAPNALRFSIAIRTAVLEGGRLHYHAGSGIVADSNPLKELEETELKAKGFRDALTG